MGAGVKYLGREQKGRTRASEGGEIGRFQVGVPGIVQNSEVEDPTVV